MDEKNDNQEMMELVLKTLLIEVYKDGQVEQSERDIINDLGSVLNVSRERFAEIIEQKRQISTLKNWLYVSAAKPNLLNLYL